MRRPTDAAWTPALRVRAAEPRYRAAGGFHWGYYQQARAQAEAALGAHAAALRWFDGWTAPARPDTTPAALPAGTRAEDALTAIVRAADTARVVMLNERHHAAADRLLPLALLAPLRARGYRYLAAEAFDARDTALFAGPGARPYARVGASGVYTDDPVFGAVVREAVRLGYTLVPYEADSAGLAHAADGLDSAAAAALTGQARRDRAQARALYARTLGADSSARVLVHAGFGHVQEEPTRGWTPMAHYFRALSGVNPVTVDQTALAERGTAGGAHPARRAALAAGLAGPAPVVLADGAGRPLAPAGYHVDLEVVGAATAERHGRPAWVTLGGRGVLARVATPACARRWCMLEVRPADEPDDAVPFDRVEVDASEAVWAALPRGAAARLRLTDAAGAVVASWRLAADARPAPRGAGPRAARVAAPGTRG
jgi:hypothetical protein